MNRRYLPVLFCILAVFFNSCHKETTLPVSFSAYTVTNSECEIVGAIDSTAWFNDVLNLALDTALLTFSTNVTISDTLAGIISVAPVCPDPSNGFFVWNISSTRQCLLKLVCININDDIIYYNAYNLNGGPMEIAFDFRYMSAFHPNNNYRMYYAFYTANDSVYYSGHGDFRIQ